MEANDNDANLAWVIRNTESIYQQRLHAVRRFCETAEAGWAVPTTIVEQLRWWAEPTLQGTNN